MLSRTQMDTEVGELSWGDGEGVSENQHGFRGRPRACLSYPALKLDFGAVISWSALVSTEEMSS